MYTCNAHLQRERSSHTATNKCLRCAVRNPSGPPGDAISPERDHRQHLQRGRPRRLPTSGVYASSKFALEAISEALAREEAEHGIHVLIVEPGAFRTNFLSAYVAAERGLGGHSEDGVVGKAMNRRAEYQGKQIDDP